MLQSRKSFLTNKQSREIYTHYILGSLKDIFRLGLPDMLKSSRKLVTLGVSGLAISFCSLLAEEALAATKYADLLVPQDLIETETISLMNSIEDINEKTSLLEDNLERNYLTEGDLVREIEDFNSRGDSLRNSISEDSSRIVELSERLFEINPRINELLEGNFSEFDTVLQTFYQDIEYLNSERDGLRNSISEDSSRIVELNGEISKTNSQIDTSITNRLENNPYFKIVGVDSANGDITLAPKNNKVGFRHLTEILSDPLEIGRIAEESVEGATNIDLATDSIYVDSLSNPIYTNATWDTSLVNIGKGKKIVEIKNPKRKWYNFLWEDKYVIKTKTSTSSKVPKIEFMVKDNNGNVVNNTLKLKDGRNVKIINPNNNVNLWEDYKITLSKGEFKDTLFTYVNSLNSEIEGLNEVIGNNRLGLDSLNLNIEDITLRNDSLLDGLMGIDRNHDFREISSSVDSLWRNYGIELLNSERDSLIVNYEGISSDRDSLNESTENNGLVIGNINDVISWSEFDLSQLRGKITIDSLSLDFLGNLTCSSVEYNQYFKDRLEKLDKENKLIEDLYDIRDKVIKHIGDPEDLRDDVLEDYGVYGGLKTNLKDLGDIVIKMTQGSVSQQTADTLNVMASELNTLREAYMSSVERDINTFERIDSDSSSVNEYANELAERFGYVTLLMGNIGVTPEIEKLPISNIQKGTDNLRGERKEAIKLRRGIKGRHNDFKDRYEESPKLYAQDFARYYASLILNRHQWQERLDDLNGIASENPKFSLIKKLNKDRKSIGKLIKTIDGILEPQGEVETTSTRERSSHNPFENTCYEGIGIGPEVTTDKDGNMRYGLAARINLDNFLVSMGGNFAINHDEGNNVFLDPQDQYGIQSRITTNTSINENSGTAYLKFSKPISSRFEVGVGPLYEMKERETNRTIQEETLEYGNVVSGQPAYPVNNTTIEGNLGVTAGLRCNVTNYIGFEAGVDYVDGEGRIKAGLTIGK